MGMALKPLQGAYALSPVLSACSRSPDCSFTSEVSLADLLPAGSMLSSSPRQNESGGTLSNASGH